MMTERPHRKFTLLDAMILTAAMAAGFALIRSSDREIWNLSRAHGWRWYRELLREGIWYYRYLLIALAPSLLLIQFLPPRRRLRKVLRRPGMIACCATIFASAIPTTIDFIMTAKEKRLDAFAKGFLTSRYFLGEQDGTNIVFAVLGSWMTLILIGWWRPERHWIDRMGRFLGFAWIAGYVITQIDSILVRIMNSQQFPEAGSRPSLMISV